MEKGERGKNEKKKKKTARIEIGAARFQSRHICTVDSISWRKRANNWPESRRIKRHPGSQPFLHRRRGFLVLHRDVIPSLTRARKEATGRAKGVLQGELGEDNIPRIHFGSQFREASLAKFVLIVPRIGFGGLRQEALWKMLRPYRHWLVKGTFYRRSGTLSPSRKVGTYPPSGKLSQ